RLLADMQLAAGQRDDAGRVVAAVLQAPQSLYQYRLRLAVAGVTHDAAHGAFLEPDEVFRRGPRTAAKWVARDGYGPPAAPVTILRISLTIFAGTHTSRATAPGFREKATPKYVCSRWSSALGASAAKGPPAWASAAIVSCIEI